MKDYRKRDGRSRTVGEAGVALLEFALIVPLLMLLLVGLIETGRFAYYSILVGNAARAGVQFGAQTTSTALDNAGMQLAATNDGQSVSGLVAVASHSCQCWNGTIATPDPGTAASCNSPVCPAGYHHLIYVQVNTTGTLQPLFHYPGLPQHFNVSAHALMRAAGQ